MVKGLGNIVHAAAFQRANDQPLVVGRRQKNDGNLSPIQVRANSTANLKSVHLRHEQVEQDEVGPPDRQSLQGLRSAGCRQDFETQFAQGGANDLDVGFLVIDDEQTAGVGFW